MDHKSGKMLLLHTRTHFDAAHQLRKYDGACSRLHGHRWEVEVWMRGVPELASLNGILFDFKRVKEIVDALDHQYLNEISPFDVANPTAETLSMYFYSELKRDAGAIEFKVRVFEAPESWCEYGDF